MGGFSRAVLVILATAVVVQCRTNDPPSLTPSQRAVDGSHAATTAVSLDGSPTSVDPAPAPGGTHGAWPACAVPGDGDRRYGEPGVSPGTPLCASVVDGATLAGRAARAAGRCLLLLGCERPTPDTWGTHVSIVVVCVCARVARGGVVQCGLTAAAASALVLPHRRRGGGGARRV